MQEAPLCRFCLDTNETTKNPLLQPCSCRGSMRFVHKKCLMRWRVQDPIRNAEICLLCLTPYILEAPMIEQMPDDTGLIGLVLRAPLFLSVGVNYLFILHCSVLPNRNVSNDLFEVYQYIYQLLFFSLFATFWRVQNKRSYFLRWRTKEVLCFVVLHSLSNYSLHNQQFFAILPLNVAMSFYWFYHKKVLQEMNLEH